MCHYPTTRSPGKPWPAGRHSRRMLALRGCVQPALAPSIDAALAMRPESTRPAEQPLQMQPHQERPSGIDLRERFLVSLFLRRYVTYCARRGHFAQMGGAARLLRAVSRTAIG